MPKKILAVDDESDVLILVKTTLETEGFDVVTAPDGPQALERLKTENPDLIILDFMMPGMTGFEVLEKIKATPAWANIPIIMLTGLSEKDRIRSALEKGISYYIVKPFDFVDLISKVNVALNPSFDETMDF